MALNEKQERFADEYQVDLNATQAAIRAGYSKKTAGQIGERLLKNVEIKQKIERALKERKKRSKTSADRVIREIALLAYSDIGNIIDFTGDSIKLKNGRDITPAARRTISSVKVKRHFEGRGDDAREVEIIEFKLWDKTSALEKLARHINLYREREPLEVLLASLPADLANAIRESLQRAILDGGDSPGSPACSTDQSNPQANHSRPSLPDAGGGAHPRSLAGRTDTLPESADSSPMHKTSRQVENRGGEGAGPLLD